MQWDTRYGSDVDAELGVPLDEVRLSARLLEKTHAAFQPDVPDVVHQRRAFHDQPITTPWCCRLDA